ncbi:MAG: tRNA lysidine(34) synthetase TilS [Candidatus Omnitrophica bacterium]|nr:tRNA lysidine(34) synthetase TilS [Candidatus Omnitrophota bacterium]
MVRFRRGKDKIKPLGMVHYKKLKKLFIDEKAPFENRNRIPLVISGGRIIWVCGVKRSDHAKVGTRAKKVLRLKFLQY